MRHFKKDEKFVDLDVSKMNLNVRGDVKLAFYDQVRGRRRGIKLLLVYTVCAVCCVLIQLLRTLLLPLLLCLLLPLIITLLLPLLRTLLLPPYKPGHIPKERKDVPAVVPHGTILRLY